MIEQYLTPALVVGVGLALWRLIHADINGLKRDVRQGIAEFKQKIRRDIARLNERINRHLEGHPKSPVLNITDHPAHDSDPAWSPDGRELTFISDRGGSPSVYRALADGSEVRQLTDEEGTELQPNWSPLGICFVSNRYIE